MNYLSTVSIITIIALVFLTTLIPSHNAFGVLYVIVIVFINERCTARTLRIVAAVCLMLDCSAFLIVHWSTPYGDGISRLSLSVIAIIIVTFIIERSRSARETLEKQSQILAHADRIKTLGQIGIAIAHEINQPLSAIATFAQSGSRWLRRPNPDIEEALSCLRQIDENARRAGDIIRNFRELTRIEQVERRTSLDLKKLTQEAIAIVNFGEYSGKVEIQRAMGGEYP